MNQTLIAVFFYFALCASIGYSRGLRRETLVLGVSTLVLAGTVLAQNQIHDLVWASLTNRDRLLPSWSELMPKTTWLSIRRQLQDSPISLLVWLSTCVLAYWFSQTRLQQGKNPRRALGSVASILNGALYLNLMVPLLSRNLLWPAFDLQSIQTANLSDRAAELLDFAVTNRPTVLTVLSIAVLIYLVSRRRQVRS